jgi:hypothetical protein
MHAPVVCSPDSVADADGGIGSKHDESPSQGHRRRSHDHSGIYHYQDDLIYYTERHLYLVGCSMLLALLCGIPVSILLSRPYFARHAEK